MRGNNWVPSGHYFEIGWAVAKAVSSEIFVSSFVSRRAESHEISTVLSSLAELSETRKIGHKREK
jgi:hypothetical protein